MCLDRSNSINTKYLYSCFITSYVCFVHVRCELWIFRSNLSCSSKAERQSKDNNDLVRIIKQKHTAHRNPMNEMQKSCCIEYFLLFGVFLIWLSKMLSMTLLYGIQNGQNVRTARFNKNEILWIHNVGMAVLEFVYKIKSIQWTGIRTDEHDKYKMRWTKFPWQNGLR